MTHKRKRFASEDHDESQITDYSDVSLGSSLPVTRFGFMLPPIEVVLEFRPRPARVAMSKSDGEIWFHLPVAEPRALKEGSASYSLHEVRHEFVELQGPEAAQLFLQNRGPFASKVGEAHIGNGDHLVSWTQICTWRELVVESMLSEAWNPEVFRIRSPQLGTAPRICGVGLQSRAGAINILDPAELIAVSKPSSLLDAFATLAVLEHIAGVRYGRCANKRCKALFRRNRKDKQSCGNNSCSSTVSRQHKKQTALV